MAMKGLRKLLRVLAVWMAISSVGGLSFAQENRGTIVGIVTDSSGAIIPGAAIRITNVATNVTVTTVSNEEGNFEVRFLNAGIYRLNAESAGFKSFVRQNLQVRLGDRLAVPVAMELGDVSEQVTITAESPVLETASASLGQVVDTRRVAELPVAHGNPFLLMTLTAGVAFTQNASLDRPFEPTHIVGYSMGGVRANRSEITLDGAPNTALNNRWGRGDLMAGYTPPADVVSEVKVQSTIYDASVGHTQGGLTAVTTKSGGNEFHGSAYYSMLRPSLNANLFFANRAGQERPDFDYHRWGGSLTGPIMLPKYDGRNRTFFTYGYEGIKEGRPRGSILTVPTEAERRGDFSDLLRVGSQYQIYDPATRVPAAGGRFAVQPLPGNIIPTSRIDPIATNILSYFALPNDPGTVDFTNNLVKVNVQEQIKYYNHIARVDHNFSNRHRMFGRFNTYNRRSDNSDWFGTIATGNNEDWTQYSVAVDDVYELSPRTVLNVRSAFYRLAILQFPKADNIGFDLASLGFPRSYTDAIDPGVRAFPHINIANYAQTVNNWWGYPHQNWALEGQVSTVRGRHSIKYGGGTRYYRTFQWDPHNASSGSFAFSTNWTRGPFDNSPGSPKGQGLASMLFGLPTGGGVDRKDSFAQQSSTYSVFFQDDWSVTRRLTLNLGVRYELEGPLTERFNRTVSGYDYAVQNPLNDQVRARYALNPIAEIPVQQFNLMGGLQFPGTTGQPRTLWRRDKNNIMPRFGFAFAARQSTVIRGGYGLYYGPLGGQRMDSIQTGFSQRTELIPSIDNGLTFQAPLGNPFPGGVQAPPGASEGLLTFVGRSTEFFYDRPLAPLQQRWNFGVQQLLPNQWLLDISYMGNRGSDLETSRPLLNMPLEYLSRSPFRDQPVIDYLTQQVPNPFYPLLPGTGLANQTVSRGHLLSGGEYAHFTGLNTTDNLGYSWYHSGQLKLERRFSSGFSVSGAYTWSKYMQATSRLNGYFSPLEYVISDQDRPHRLVVSGMWELPFGRGHRFLTAASGFVERVVGGWQLQGFYTAQSGAPLGFGNALFIGDIHDITLPVSERTPERWFNTNAGFEKIPARQLQHNYRLLPTRFNNVRADGIRNWDLSVLKNTLIREGMNAQFRAEFLNAMNHVNFAAPNTSPTSTAFGQVTAQQGYARRIQMVFRLVF